MNSQSKVVKIVLAIVTNLTFWVLIAILFGMFVGYKYPSTGIQMKVVGDGFISIIKVFIVPIIFLTIVLGIGGMGDLKKVGRIGIKSLVYFEIVSTIALAFGVLFGYVAQPGKIDKTGLDIQDASKYTSGTADEFSWVSFLMSNTTLQVLIVAIIVGIGLNYHSKRVTIVAFLYKCSKIVFKALKYVMYLAPVGAFGGMAYTIGKFGLHTLIPVSYTHLTLPTTYC
jgi:aerobic C4-dicarboxylate transport protein